jgi:mono/diheme cytochrome c family protein
MHALLIWATLAICGIAAAQSVPQVKKTTASATSPASGKEMYLHYCASCHGKEGKGDGPAAPAMKPAPTDLTQLAMKNLKFPDLRVTRVIDGSDDLAAHGSRDMPVWGQVFREMDESTAKMRTANLTAYLQSIQKK